MSHEPTQRHNPHALTINQHVFPKASIARFAQGDGRVSIFMREQQNAVRLFPQHVIFCAKRVWNQGSEQGFMRAVERRFQTLASSVLGSGVGYSLGPTEHSWVSQFYALCRLRAEARHTPPRDVQMKAVLPGNALTKDQEEMLEKNGYTFTRGTTLPSRHMAGIRIQALMSRLCAPGTTWAVVYSRAIEFIVPDSFCEIGIVPLSPNYCFVANQGGGEISSGNAIEINRIAIDKSSKYYFARDFAKCGV